MLAMIVCTLLLMYWTNNLTWQHVGWLLLTVILVKPLQNLGKAAWTWWSRFFWLGFKSGLKLTFKAGRRLTPEETAELQLRLKAKVEKEIMEELEAREKKDFIDFEGILK